jgi:rubrerythrin
VHIVDPSGKPELELSEKYKKQAEDAENAGYQRLASTLRQLADSYANEARRIIDEHGKVADETVD